MKEKIVCLCLLLCLLLPIVASAQTENLNKAVEGTGLARATSIKLYIGSLIKVALGFLGVAFVILIMYGGYTWMMARGDEKEVEKAQGIIKAAIIGVVIVLCSYIITEYVISTAIRVSINAS